MLANAVSCNKADAKLLKAKEIENIPAPSETDRIAYSDGMWSFGLKLLATTEKTANELISPLSVFLALADTANGAAGNTKAQTEAALGVDTRTADICSGALIAAANKGNSLKIADSVWFCDTLKIKDDFTSAAKSYFDAAIYSADFASNAAKSINDWVSRKTSKRIKEIIKETDENSRVIIVNALTFDGKWRKPYEDTSGGIFTDVNADEQKVTYLTSAQKYKELGNGDGIVKEYAGNYAFVALLPDENTSMTDFISSLSAEVLSELASGKSDSFATVKLPKFTAAGDYRLKENLKAIGITDAFDANADFSGITEEGYLYIDEVFHKTYIKVDENGTEAAAATAVDVKDEAADEYETDKTIVFDRPFAYMIIDTETDVPVFMGIANHIG